MRWHCWLRLRRHAWEWHDGIHHLMRYRRCRECYWTGGQEVITHQNTLPQQLQK